MPELLNSALAITTAAMLLVLSPVQANANELLPQNFAYHAEIAESANSLRELVLPTDVLQEIQRKDMGDLRVFNAQDQAVPHQFISAASTVEARKTRLNYYPFDHEQAADPAAIRIHIQQGSDKQSIQLDSTPQQLGTSNQYHYIAENKNQSQALCALDLDWQQPRPSMVLTLKVEGSDDLQHWSTLNPAARVSRLDYAGSQLLKSRIEINCNRHDYLRLSWAEPQAGLELKAITAIYPQAEQTPKQQIMLGKPQLDNQGNWIFETRGSAVVTELALLAPLDGLLYKGKLYTRADIQSKWRHQQSVIQYRMQINGLQLQSDPIKLSGSKDRFWKIELDDTTSFTAAQLPDIQLGWSAQKLAFLAQGSAPFTLALGNPDVAPAANNGIQQLLRTLNDAGEKPDTVSISALKPNPSFTPVEKSTPWKLLGLWTFLILGTLVLGYMAWHLYRQMQQAGD